MMNISKGVSALHSASAGESLLYYKTINATRPYTLLNNMKPHFIVRLKRMLQYSAAYVNRDRVKQRLYLT
jgi:hypothetical protein